MPELLSDPLFLTVALLSVFIDGVSKGGFSGGLGVVAVPIMAVAIDPVRAAAIMLPILCAMDVFNLWVYRGKWDWRESRLLIAAGSVGVAIGAVTFHYLNEDAIRLLLGLLAVGFVSNWAIKLIRRKVPPPAPHSIGKGGFWGTMAGFTSFVAHAGGPPVSVYLLPRKLDKTTYQATSVLVFAMLNVIKLVPYALLGQLSFDNLGVALALLPVGLVGVAAGVWAHKALPERPFFIVLYSLLAILGIHLMWSSITALAA